MSPIFGPGRGHWTAFALPRDDTQEKTHGICIIATIFKIKDLRTAGTAATFFPVSRRQKATHDVSHFAPCVLDTGRSDCSWQLKFFRNIAPFEIASFELKGDLSPVMHLSAAIRGGTPGICTTAFSNPPYPEPRLFNKKLPTPLPQGAKKCALLGQILNAQEKDLTAVLKIFKFTRICREIHVGMTSGTSWFSHKNTSSFWRACLSVCICISEASGYSLRFCMATMLHCRYNENNLHKKEKFFPWEK